MNCFIAAKIVCFTDRQTERLDRLDFAMVDIIYGVFKCDSEQALNLYFQRQMLVQERSRAPTRIQTDPALQSG